MLIDWFTVGAQALNFVILVWLMKHFLYKPILHAVDAREKLIATELASADAKKAEGEKERLDLEHKNADFDKERATLVTKATDEAKAEGKRLLAEAHQAADAESAKRREALSRDAHDLEQTLSRRTQKEVFAIVRKALSDLATTSLEERMGEVFTRRLREMDGKAKASLGGTLKAARDPALVRSVFDLPPEQRAAIQNALNETFSAAVRVKFETAPDLVCGIELVTDGKKVGWNIAEYVASLVKGVGDLLKQKEKAEAKPEPKVESKPEAKVEPKPGAKAEPKPEAKPEPKPKIEAEPKPAAKPEPKVEAKVEPKPETKPEPKPEIKVQPKPEAKVEPQPAAKPAVKPEPKPEIKVEPKPEAKVEPQPEAKPEPQPEAKPNPKPKPPAPATEKR